MSGQIRNIEREELQQKLRRGDTFKLVMALSAHDFERKRIPGSIQLNEQSAMFTALEKDEDIVIYCTNAMCPRSLIAAQRLADHGYTHVSRYVAGLLDWEAAGLPLEGSLVNA